MSVGSRVIEVLLASESEMFAEVLDLLTETFSSELGLFGTIDLSTGALVCTSISMTRGGIEGHPAPSEAVMLPPETWDGIWRRVLVEGRSFYCNEPHDAPRGHPAFTRSLGAPILYQNTLIGSIHVANRSTDYDAADASLMEGIASILAPVLSARLERDREDQRRRAAEEALGRHAMDLARSNAELERRDRRLKEQIEEITTAQEIIRCQRQRLRELSTPIIEVWDGVVVAPLVGSLDASRVHQLLAQLLKLTARSRAEIALVDITGLTTLDAAAAQHLSSATAAVRLLGAKVVLTGARAPAVRAMAKMGIDLPGVVMRSSLASGLRFAFNRLRLRVVQGAA